MDHTDPSRGFKTPSRKKNYEASEDEDAVKLWHLGAPFLDSKPPGAVRPDFDEAKEAKIRLISKKIRAGLDAKIPNSDSESEEDTSSAPDSKSDASLHVTPASVVVTTDPEASSTPGVPSNPGLTSGMKAEFAQLLSSMEDSFTKLLEGRGDLSMDGEVLDHVQVELTGLVWLLYLFAQGSPSPGLPGTPPDSMGHLGLVSRRSGLPSPLTVQFRSYQGLAHGASPSLRFPTSQAPPGHTWAPFGMMVPFYQKSVPLHNLQMGMRLGSLMRTALPSNTFVESQDQFSGSLPIEVVVNQRSPSSSEDEEVFGPVADEALPVSATAPEPVPKPKEIRKSTRNRKQTKRWYSE